MSVLTEVNLQRWKECD